MESVIREMYHGWTDIQENMELPEEYGALRGECVAAQDELLARLDEKTRAMCLRVMEMQTALSSMEAEAAFAAGMKLGARMTRELLAGE